MDPSDFFENCEICRSDLESPARLDEIYRNPRHYYWTQDWSPETYIALARAGFISISLDVGLGKGLLFQLPEIQESYAVLDWENIHASKSMRRWMRSEKCLNPNFRLEIGYDLSAVMRGICNSHPTNWLAGPYEKLLFQLNKKSWDGFELMPVGLVSDDGNLVAGEVGYRTGDVYTSLTGFFDRSDPAFRNVGKLQLIRLAELLRDEGFAFWNLGHPSLQYKIDLGAKILPRHEFLKRWQAAV